MNTWDELYQNYSSSFGERAAASVIGGTKRVARAASNARDAFIKERLLRATEMALDGLPESIRSDIGWPDLYERQVRK